MSQILECKIGQENCQKKGNLRGLRAENSRSFAIFLYDLAIIATRARVSISVNPSPIWCSVRFPLNPLEFNEIRDALY